MVRNKSKTKNTCSPSFHFSQAQLQFWLFHLPNPSATGREGMGVAVSSLHVVPAAPSSSCCSPASLWGPTHRLPCLAWAPSMGYSPSGKGCYSVGLPLGHRSCQETCSYMGSSPQAVAPARSLLLCGLSMGCRGTTGFTMVSSMGCRGISALVSETPPTLLPFWPRCHRAVPHTFFLTPHCHAAFWAFFKHVFPEAPLWWLRGSAMPCGGWLEPLESKAGPTAPWLLPGHRHPAHYVSIKRLAQEEMSWENLRTVVANLHHLQYVKW